MSEDNKQIADKGFVQGVCKWFNTTKAYGFIEMPDGGLDVFVHAKQLRQSGINRALKEGEMIRFQTSQGPKGNFATNITIVE